MAQDIRAKAETALKEVEKVTAMVLPEPKGDLIVVSEVTPDMQKSIKSRMDEIDMDNTASCVAVIWLIYVCWMSVTAIASRIGRSSCSKKHRGLSSSKSLNKQERALGNGSSSHA